MSIQPEELRWYRSAVVSDAGGNGGRMSANHSASGVKGNIWPDVSQAERASGSLKYRKLYIKVANPDNLVLQEARVFVETFTPADDEVTLIPGDFGDTQADLTGSERQYGAGQLDADASAAATSITVLTEGGAASGIFQNGDLVRVSDKSSVDDTEGTEEYLRLAASGAVSWDGDVATLTFDAGVELGASYLAAQTRVASVIEAGDVQAQVDDLGVTSASGTYDDAEHPPEVDHIGGISQVWTVTFTGATTFDVTGDTVGSVGSGGTGADFSPNNPDFDRPYFTLPAAAWGGTWTNGDSLVFTTHPAAVPVWYKRRVPEGASSFAANQVIVAIAGESE